MGAEKIGFVGLGEMGKPMAKNLVKKGFSLTVYDVRTEPVEELKALGATRAKSLRELAEVSNRIIMMVRDVPQTEEVIFGKDGVWEGLKEGSTIIITSTLDPFFCRSLEAKAKEKNVGVLDACVSGAKMGAEAGTLTIISGGKEDTFKECLPVLEAMGTKIHYMGGVGAGQITKLANNLMMHVNIAGATEALALTIKGGIEPDRFLDVVKKSTGNSWVIENWDLMLEKKRDLRDGKPDATFKGSLTLMDSMLRIARHMEIRLPVTALISHLDEGNGLLSVIEGGLK